MIATAESVTDLKLYDLLEEFIKLLRSGQGVPVREFAKRFPEHAERITADFPALLMAEGIKPRVAVSPAATEGSNSQESVELLAGYRVIRQIGQGGMGIVYEAEHPRLSRRLAVKVLPGHKRNKNLVERFRREAEAASRLNHPNIVPVFDFGEHNGVPYIAMPLVEGRSLDQLLEEYRLVNRSSAETACSAGLLTMVTNTPWNQTGKASGQSLDFPGSLIGPEADFRKLAALGAEVAEALAHAHEHGTIHRDIKPGNLILDKEGKIWVTDFGLAKVRDDDSDLSRTGDVIGTPRFMSPEQLRGHCDERSDVYSLGITLYEMASGVRAWDSLNSAQLLRVRASAELPELSEQAPFVPRALADIIMKACSSRPEDRYQTAQELRVVLTRFAHGQKTGDRRRRSRNGTSLLDRRWIIVGCSAGIPALTFAALFAFGLGPWAPAALTTPEALISLVENDQHREKVVAQLPEMIEAAMTSKDANVREKAGELTLRVVSEALQKSEANSEQKTQIKKRVGEVIEEYKKTGFVYDRMNHPLTNAIRNLSLADEISKLTLAAEDKLASQMRIASVGEAIRNKLFTVSEIEALVKLLPEEAQVGPVTSGIKPLQLLRFLMLLESTIDHARERMTANQKKIQQDLERQLAKEGVKLPVGQGKIKLPKNLSIPEMKGRSIPNLKM